MVLVGHVVWFKSLKFILKEQLVVPKFSFVSSRFHRFYLRTVKRHFKYINTKNVDDANFEFYIQ